MPGSGGAHGSHEGWGQPRVLPLPLPARLAGSSRDEGHLSSLQTGAALSHLGEVSGASLDTWVLLQSPGSPDTWVPP